MTETGEDWLNPMNKLIWIKAFRAKQTTVAIRDGRKFTVRYFDRKGVPTIHVKPVDGFVPMGYFEYKKVTHNSWLSDNGHNKP